jgi:glyoxylase I family protein
MASFPGIQHVAVTVRDLSVSVPWYEMPLDAKPALDKDADPGFHISFGVADGRELEKWAGRLDEPGVDHGEIKDASYGSDLSFRDPDGIALEFFCAPPA